MELCNGGCCRDREDRQTEERIKREKMEKKKQNKKGKKKKRERKKNYYIIIYLFVNYFAFVFSLTSNFKRFWGFRAAKF